MHLPLNYDYNVSRALCVGTGVSEDDSVRSFGNLSATVMGKCCRARCAYKSMDSNHKPAILPVLGMRLIHY